MTGINYRDFITTTTPHKALVLVESATKDATITDASRCDIRWRTQTPYRMLILYTTNLIFPLKSEREYDPDRSGFIGLAVYQDGEKRYVLLPRGQSRSYVFGFRKSSGTPRQSSSLRAIPVDTFVYNVSLKPGGKALIARSAGNAAKVKAQEGDYTFIELPSTEVRKVINTAWATIGTVSNEENHLVSIGKAGRSRWLGIRPTVRGSAQNPPDHPYGGGEGRQGRGLRRAKTRWGKPSGKGQKTRTPKKYSNVFIVSRRKVGTKRTSG